MQRWCLPNGLATNNRSNEQAELDYQGNSVCKAEHRGDLEILSSCTRLDSHQGREVPLSTSETLSSQVDKANPRRRQNSKLGATWTIRKTSQAILTRRASGVEEEG